MDAALLTTVEQLSDDTPNNRGAAGWPAGPALANSPQSGLGVTSALQNSVRDGQNGAADPHERIHPVQPPLDPSRPQPYAVAWRGAVQEDLNWPSAIASQSLSDEAPGVFTITDRKVRGGDDPFDIPIYTLCRRWVRNDPFNDEVASGQPARHIENLQLPEPLPAQAGADSPYPIEGPFPSSSNGEPDPEYLLEHHMTHWLKVREHHLKKICRKSARYKHRLQILLQRSHLNHRHNSNGQPPARQHDGIVSSTGLLSHERGAS